MAANYWQPEWFLTGWFPAVWFAPADETGVPPEELREEYYGGGGTAHYRGRAADDERLHREHWDFIDALRAAQDQAADAIRRAGTTDHAGSAAPGAIGARAMRGTVPLTQAPPVVAAKAGNPLMLAALALLIDDD